MTPKLNCQYLSTRINVIKSKKALFEVAFLENNIEVSAKLMREIGSIILEIEESIWPLERLTKENIQKQYGQWQEMYKDFYPNFKFPSVEKILEFLQNDRGFVELMKIKEKQGLVRLVIAPAPGSFSLNDLVKKLGQKVQERGGSDNFIRGVWHKMLAEEDSIRYFGKVDYPGLTDVNQQIQTDGLTAEEIMRNPSKYGICNGWLISFTTDEQDILSPDEPELDTGNGRKAIKTGLRVSDYFDRYFNGKNENYVGEEPMLPQEHIALFAKDFYEKYTKTEKMVGMDHCDLFDYENATWFVGTYLSGERQVPYAYWNPGNNSYYCGNYIMIDSSNSIGVRSVVRRSIKSKS